jgi:hypothetical protein
MCKIIAPKRSRSKRVASFVRCSQSILLVSAGSKQIIRRRGEKDARGVAAAVADQGKHRWIPGSC